MALVPKKTILDTPVEELSNLPTSLSEAGKEVRSLIEVCNSTCVPDGEDPLTIDQAADRLGVSKQTLRNWEASGKLVPHAHTKGGHRRYTASQVAALQKRLLASQETLLPGITPTWLMETGKTLLAGFAPDEKINVIFSQGVMDGVFRITIESEDGLKQIVRKFQPKA